MPTFTSPSNQTQGSTQGFATSDRCSSSPPCPSGQPQPPQVVTMIVKEVKLVALTRGIRLHQYLDDWLIRAQSQEEAQVNTQTVVDLTQPQMVDNKSGEVRTKANSGVFLRRLRIPSRFSPCKTHSREMAQTSGFDPTTQVKTCFDCKMFDVANWVACLNGENNPGGTPSHETLSVSPQGALEISSVVGHPPSLDRNHFSTPRLVAKQRSHFSCQCQQLFSNSPTIMCFKAIHNISTSTPGV